MTFTCALVAAVDAVGAGGAAFAAALAAEQAGVAASSLLSEEGTIESLDMRQRAFRLRVGSGRTSHTLRVRAPHSTPLTAGRRTITWENLREGQAVAVRWHDTTGRGTRSNQRIYPAEIELLTQVVTGRIDGVNAGSAVVRATLGELEEVTEERGGRPITRMGLKEAQEVQARRRTERFGALPGLQVLRDGQAITLRDVRDGDFFRAQVVETGTKLLLLGLELNPKLSAATTTNTATGAAGVAAERPTSAPASVPSLQKKAQRPTARVTVRRAR